MAIALTELDQDLWFPHPEQALDEPEGLLAMGGDLSPNRLRLAYRHGIFPWYEDQQPPPNRAVVFPDRFQPSRSLKRTLKQSPFHLTLDEHFEAVIAGCQQHRLEQGLGTWITQEMITAYTHLFHAGEAHCIACFNQGRLVGGLYGVSVGNVFCGESMFSKVSNGSKIAIAHLLRWMNAEGLDMLDCQLTNPHLTSLGSEMMSRDKFLQCLNTANVVQGSWTFNDQPTRPWTKD